MQVICCCCQISFEPLPTSRFDKFHETASIIFCRACAVRNKEAIDPGYRSINDERNFNHWTITNPYRPTMIKNLANGTIQ